MRTLIRATLCLAVLLAPAASPGREAHFTVTSRSLATVTIDGGRAHGLSVGDRLRVVEGETPIGEIEVVATTERWSTCRPRSLTRPIALGDRVLLPRRSSDAPAAEPRALASMKPRTTAEKPAAAPSTPLAPAPAEPPPAAAPAVARPVALPAAPLSTAGRRFTVKYRSASNAYLDAGRAAGLGVGDRLRVLSGQSTVAELEIAYAAERSASCRILSETRPVRAGDVVVLLASAGGAPETTTTATTAPPPSPMASVSLEPVEGKRPRPPMRVRGSASLGYYRSWDDTESALDFEERTARFDLGVYDIAGQPLAFTLRGRSRQDIRARTLSSRTPKDERSDRIYEAALRYEPPSDRFGLEVGRIGIYRFVGIGYLDGFLGRLRPLPGLQVGAFGGRVAEIESFGLAGTGQKYGGFVRLAPGGRYATTGYDVMLAFVRENAEGEVSREYLSLESRFGQGRWSLFQRAELDLNTGWRQEISGKSTQLSNVSLSGNMQVARSAWAFVSYDGRRSYRYHRNRLVPEEVFDDLLHQGLRAGVNVSRPGGFGATVGFGASLKEPDPRNPELEIANAWSGNAGLRHSNLFSSGLSVGLDASGFSNGYTDGGLVVARVGRRFPGGHMLDLSYGHSLYQLKLTEQDRTTRWFRLTGRGELGRRVYVLGDFEYDAGDDLKGPRGFLELGIRF